MSGGGGKKDDKDKDAVTGTTPYANAPTNVTYQPSLPGFIDAQASQLQQGFGGQGNDYLSMLQGMYTPMSLLSLQEPFSTTKQMFDKKENAPLNTGSAWLDKYLMGQKLPDEDSSSSKSDKKTPGRGGTHK